MLLASGSLLSQDNITTTATPTLVFTATLRTEISLIMITNQGANSQEVQVYHDDAGGSTYDGTTLVYENEVSSKRTDTVNFFPGSGIVMSAGGQLAVEATGTTPDINFTIYGTTEEIASNG